MNWRRFSAEATFALALLAPASVQANIGLPMIAVFLPPLWVALIPIILLEAVVIAKRKGIPFKTSVGGTALANVVSTVVGVPLLWFFLATLELICCGGALGLSNVWTKFYAVTVQAPWLIPYESEFGWMIPAALCTLALIFVVMSVAVEAPIVARLTKVPLAQVWYSIWLANIASYAALGLAGFAIAIFSVKLDGLHQAFLPLSEAMVEGVFSVATLFVRGQP